MEKEQKEELIKIIISAVLLAAALLCEHVFKINEIIYLIIYIVSFIAAGYEVIFEAFKKLIKLKPLDECFLMTVAGIGAFFTGSYAEAASIMILYGLGEFLQDLAVDKSRDSIEALMDVTPGSAEVIRGGERVEIKPEEIEIGDVIAVKRGRRIPADGTVLSGTTSLDTSAITGEPLPVDVSEGDKVISGSVNTGAEITVRADVVYENSTAAKMTALIGEAEGKKARTEAFITRFAEIYTPAVVAAALLIAIIPPIFNGMWSEWIHRALILLVISCPCALVISVPLSFFAGIGAGSRKGILVKGGEYFEALSKTEIFAFDKTGTLTYGKFAVTKICPASDREELIKTACSAEKHSDHPIAKAICALSDETYEAEAAYEIPGEGMTCRINGEDAAVGGARLMKRYGITPDDVNGAVHVMRGGKYLGYFVISDTVKPEARASAERLKAYGIKKTVMLTGDGREAAEKTAAEAGIDEVHAGLLPQDKLSELEKLIANGKTAYAGDGINDAAVLARADVGIAMGGIGSDIAVQAADIVITDDDVRKLPEAVRISKKTVGIAKQNIILALTVKALILALSVIGLPWMMWFAVFADTGVALIAAANSMRALK